MSKLDKAVSYFEFGSTLVLGGFLAAGGVFISVISVIGIKSLLES